MANELDIVGQIKFAFYHLLNLILFFFAIPTICFIIAVYVLI